ncbi:MAG TPA: hypothetical protein VKS19_03085, partial [Verrucomicrobiae bacterium]|nr:hypothetical protein [Verrucomicrobiae bacterium]
TDVTAFVSDSDTRCENTLPTGKKSEISQNQAHSNTSPSRAMVISRRENPGDTACHFVEGQPEQF